MKFSYPAVFRRLEDGRYRGYFPDLEGCEVFGDSLEDAVDEANQAALGWLTAEFEEEEPLLPRVSEPGDLESAEGEEIRNICVNFRFTEGWDE